MYNFLLICFSYKFLVISFLAILLKIKNSIFSENIL